MEGDPEDRNELPAPLDLLWGVRGRRPRKEGLNVQRVVDAAVELADEGGLEAVTMSRVAERVGFTTMALYRHVRSKDELVALMVDESAALASTSDELSSWRSGLERWAWELLALVRRHPWLLEVPLARVPFGPNRLAWLERGLEAFAETSLSEDEKAAVILLVNNYVFSEARFTEEAGNRGVESDSDAAVGLTDHGAMLSALVDAEQFPALRRALDAGLFASSEPDRDSGFLFGLELVLDGVERLVAQRETPR